MTTSDPRQNKLVSMLPVIVMERIADQMEIVPLIAGETLFDPGEPVDSVFFPLRGVVSLDQPVLDDDESGVPSVALTGVEGIVGIEAALGFESAINRAKVRIEGTAIRIAASALRDEVGRSGAMQRLLMQATDALLAQLAANSACERVHPVQIRLIRWLLLIDDRLPNERLELTQETLSQILAVRRVSVSAAAAQLQAEGLIDYRRGAIEITDRSRLESHACKCYRSIKARYAEHFDFE